MKWLKDQMIQTLALSATSENSVKWQEKSVFFFFSW